MKQALGIRITNSSKKSVESKRALKMISALSSYIFENDYILSVSEKKTLEDGIKVLNNITKRFN